MAISPTKRSHLWKTNWWVKGKCTAAKAMQVMIDNNLSFEIALYPYELVTYGKQDLSVPTGCNTTWLKLGELWQKTKPWWLNRVTPLGLFKIETRVLVRVITNGLDRWAWQHARLGNCWRNGEWPTTVRWRLVAGCTSVLKGSFTVPSTPFSMPVVSNSIVPDDGDLTGKLFISSGLGGMSGALGKAAEIAKAVAIVAEVDRSRIETRHSQGWISQSDR